MVLAFTGWMDGGEISTGTVDYLVRKLGARKMAEISFEGFYIYSFPGSMEVASLFRPHVRVAEGTIVQYGAPVNTFWYEQELNLVLFSGKEPNLLWTDFSEAVFSVAQMCNVDTILFVGSVAGLVPHTRKPRFHGSVSHEEMKELLKKNEVSFTNYDGPASIVTYLTKLASDRDISMAALVAEVPAYVQGRNVKCVAATVERVCRMLNLHLDVSDLEILAQQFEGRLDEVVKGRPELREYVHKMEQEYDKEVQDSQWADLKAWLEQQDIRLDD